MKVKKRIVKSKTGSVKVNPEVLYEAKKICIKNGWKLYNYVSLALDNQNGNNLEETA